MPLPMLVPPNTLDVCLLLADADQGQQLPQAGLLQLAGRAGCQRLPGKRPGLLQPGEAVPLHLHCAAARCLLPMPTV